MMIPGIFSTGFAGKYKFADTHIPGRDSTLVEGMAKEMHWYAAEALCGA